MAGEPATRLEEPDPAAEARGDEKARRVPQYGSLGPRRRSRRGQVGAVPHAGVQVRLQASGDEISGHDRRGRLHRRERLEASPPDREQEDPFTGWSEAERTSYPQIKRWGGYFEEEFATNLVDGQTVRVGGQRAYVRPNEVNLLFPSDQAAVASGQKTLDQVLETSNWYQRPRPKGSDLYVPLDRATTTNGLEAEAGGLMKAAERRGPSLARRLGIQQALDVGTEQAARLALRTFRGLRSLSAFAFRMVIPPLTPASPGRKDDQGQPGGGRGRAHRVGRQRWARLRLCADHGDGQPTPGQAVNAMKVTFARRPGDAQGRRDSINCRRPPSIQWRSASRARDFDST